MPNLVGIGNSQVPTNAMLGGLAYQDSVGEINIDKIKARTSDTAKDIFVYDTSKDSDGGAWRHRTQNTSWYNEGASATRGARKEFPAVAIIVVEVYQVTIYDADNPNCPMWMVFNQSTTLLGAMVGYSNMTIGCCTMLNGILMVGLDHTTQGNVAGLRLINFISEHHHWKANITGRHSSQHWPIVERNGGRGNINVDSNLIVNEVINDVDAIVLPNAPIDESTGLPIPTIAIATNGGVSFIKDNGTVFDTVATTSGYIASRKVQFSESGEYLYIIQDPSLIYSYKTSAFNVDRSSGTLAGYAALSFFSTYVSSSGPASTTKLSRGNDTTINIGHTNTGLALLYPDYTYSSNGLDNASGKLICRVTKDFNTGWMHGNIKGAFLSSTDDNNITGTELVSNPGPYSSTTGWIADNGFSVSNSNNRLVIDSDNNTGSYFGGVHTLNLVSGTQYVLVVNIHSQTKTAVIRLTGSGTYFTSTGLGTGEHAFYFTADQVSHSIRIGSDTGGDNRTQELSSVSIKEVEEDRSINKKGLQVFGTVTKSAVATGAELVAYSGFSASNYLQQPYNSDLDFGTGDLSIMFWFKLTSTGTPQCFIHRGDGGSGTWGSGNLIQIEMDTTHIEFQLSGSGFSPLNEAEVSVSYTPVNNWNHFVAVRRGGFMHVYVNGVKHGNTASSQNVSNTSAKLWVGQRPNSSRPLSNGSMALLRISSTAPTDEQIKKIYNDEKCLYHENAKCTLHGTSDEVTGLAYDDTNDILHVGTSAGRSEFQGLSRINNTTTAVTTAISASNELVAEQ